MKTAYVTEKGSKRTNQDALLILQAQTFLGKAVFAVICDGMGGLQKGELASAVVIRAFERWFLNTFPSILESGFNPDKLFESWQRIIRKTNEDLIICGNEFGIKIGTTIAGILLLRNQFYIINVGDSRIYEITEYGIRCLTKDHSLVMREVEEGRLSPKEMEHDRRRHILLQCIGASGEVNPDFIVGDTGSRRLYMLCSDGFRHEITPKEFYEALCPQVLNNNSDMKKALEKLVYVNLQRGERDNVTAVSIYVEDNDD